MGPGRVNQEGQNATMTPPTPYHLSRGSECRFSIDDQIRYLENNDMEFPLVELVRILGNSLKHSMWRFEYPESPQELGEFSIQKRDQTFPPLDRADLFYDNNERSQSEENKNGRYQILL